MKRLELTFGAAGWLAGCWSCYCDRCFRGWLFLPPPLVGSFLLLEEETCRRDHAGSILVSISSETLTSKTVVLGYAGLIASTGRFYKYTRLLVVGSVAVLAGDGMAVTVEDSVGDSTTAREFMWSQKSPSKMETAMVTSLLLLMRSYGC
jgi:hypothetical protein